MAETEIVFTVEEAPEGGYQARAIGYSIYTQADGMIGLKMMLQDAVRCHFEGQPGPLLIRMRKAREEVIPV